MQEKNRNILTNAIRELPLRKAPAVVWDEIDSRLPLMDVSGLPVHHVPVSVWEGVESGLNRWDSVRMALWLIIPLAFLVTGGVFWYFDHQDHIKQPVDTPARNNTIISANTPDSRNVVRSADVPLDDIINMQQETLLREAVVQDPEESICLEDYSISWLPLLSPEALELDLQAFIPLQTETIVKGGHDRQDQYRDCDFNRPEQYWYLGPAIEYQHFFSGGLWQDTDMKTWASGEFIIGWQYERFSVEAGLGYAISSDETKSDYSWREYELVDTYEYVDSIYIDPNTGTVHYYTTTVEVFDSVDHTSGTSLTTRYQYFHVPVMLGLTVYRQDGFSLSLKAGGAFITQLGILEKNSYTLNGNSRILGTGSEPAIRRENYIRFSGGLAFSWKIGKNWRLILEPAFHYYPKPLYKGNNGKNTLSGSFKAGFLYEF
ncbi:MAG: hypothetical protein KKA81_08400 [Bacteroidetes bacterium]|nr:hypothetical protein [Bacteroidota bacterium]